jgi:DNA-binding CsgD family transcriptional regulator
MHFQDSVSARHNVERLMTIAAIVSDLSGDLESLHQIPNYIADLFSLRRAHLALLRVAADAEPEFLVLAASDSREPPTAVFANGLRDLCLSPAWIVHRATGAPVNVPGWPGVDTSAPFGSAIAIIRAIDPVHFVVLVIEQTPAPGPAAIESFGMITNHIARTVGAWLVWQASPEVLGHPFADLTNRECNVLTGLDSEQAEKQLADQLNLSPHTFHSHVKAIYRKAGVQGRLPLLQRLHHAVHRHRAQHLLECLGTRTGERAVG